MTWAYIRKKSPSLEELMTNLPDVKQYTILNKRLSKVKYNDKGKISDRSKF